MAPSLAIIRQDNFSGGMWPTLNAERVPPNGVHDATNALIDDTGGLYRRGGTTVFAGTGWPASDIVWVWQGTLTGGNRTLFATAANLYSINGATITNLGVYTGMASGVNRPVVSGGVMYFGGTGAAAGPKYDGTTFSATGAPFVYSYVTSVANRLVVGNYSGDASQIAFSGVGTLTFAATDTWKIPGGVTITGVATLRDAAVVFTDQGTWVISNMALNLTDTAGNVQQRLDLYSPDMVQWGTGAAGVVGYQGGLVIPARDGVWLMQLGSTSEAPRPLTLLSGPISEAYRSYVTAGYKPGQAAVFRGHYFLPILNANKVTKCLVCRLDLPSRPWTQFDITGGANAFTASQDGLTLIGATGVGNTHLSTLNYFDGTGTDWVSGTDPPMSITTRDMLTGPLTKNTITKVRFGYRLSAGSNGDGIATISYGGSADGVYAITTPTTLGTLAATGSLLTSNSLLVGKHTRGARFKFATSGTASKAAIQSIEMFVRSSGRQ